MSTLKSKGLKALKIAGIAFASLLALGIFATYFTNASYDSGVQYYNAGQYEKALKSLEAVPSGHDKYTDAQKLIAQIRPLINSNNIKESTHQTKPKTLEELYEISKEEDNNPNTPRKAHIYIKLYDKISKDTLTMIAEEILSKKKKYDRVYIYYYLPTSIGVWATTHWQDNQWEMQIMGSTAEEEKMSIKLASEYDGKLIGRYFEDCYIGTAYTFFEKDNKTYLKTSDKGQKAMTQEMKKTNTPKGIKLSNNIYDSHNNYFIIDSEGKMHFYNGNTLKCSASKL